MLFSLNGLLFFGGGLLLDYLHGSVDELKDIEEALEIAESRVEEPEADEKEVGWLVRVIEDVAEEEKLSRDAQYAQHGLIAVIDIQNSELVLDLLVVLGVSCGSDVLAPMSDYVDTGKEDDSPLVLGSRYLHSDKTQHKGGHTICQHIQNGPKIGTLVEVPGSYAVKSIKGKGDKVAAVERNWAGIVGAVADYQQKNSYITDQVRDVEVNTHL